MAGRNDTGSRRGPHVRAQSLSFEHLEVRHLLTSHPVISEFLAVNDTNLADEDGEFSDWLEVHNPNPLPVDLNGWYVTDDAGNLTKWQFPDVAIPADGQLLVFASNKDRRDPLGELHTSFRLSGNGEYLALVEPDGATIAHDYAPQFPPQTADVSYGLSPGGSIVGFFPQPTPGAANVNNPISNGTIVISEIMYHPFHPTIPLTAPGENTLEEYIEIYNSGQAAVDLTGWRFDRGINFVFPQVTLAADEYLVIAADLPTFQANYPGVTEVVGGWLGKLSNRSEEIRLVDSLDVTIDTVTYADQGDWAVRTEGPLDMGFRGWIWEAEHDGSGKTLELINLAVSNEFGQNWSTSIPDGGTPGAVNSVETADTGPIILDVIHAPAVPRASDPVTVTARIADPTAGSNRATLYWRLDGESGFQMVTMHDDGQHGDRAAGDSTYGATIPAQPDESVVEFYIHASDAQQNVATWPAPIKPATPVEETALVGENAAARAVVPSDDSLSDRWTGGDELFDDSAWTSGSNGIGFETTNVAPTVAAPVAYWTFDELEAGGTRTPDVLGRYDGAVVGATLTNGGQGMFGEALTFDGDNDYVLPGVISELVDTSAFAISLWFRRIVDHAGVADETSHTVNNVLIAQSIVGANDNLEIGSEGDAVEVYLDTVDLGGLTTTVSQPASLQNDTWHHLVVNYDSGEASELKLYVDGTLVSEHSEYGGLLNNATAPFTIGLSRPESSAWGDFEGLIDDVAVWDTSLDAQHVTALFNGTSPVEISGYADLISLDLQGALQNLHTTAYARFPFLVNDPGTLDSLNLRMQYDDAFVAYINGTEVAREGLVGVPQWDSAADADRPDFDALSPDVFKIANRPGLLADGENILAIQLLNFEANATRALLRPELVTEPAEHVTNAQYQVLDMLAGDVIELVDAGAAARALVPANGSLGNTWTGGTASFDDTAWVSGTTGVGYETSPLPPIAAPIAYWTFDELQAGGTIAPDMLERYDSTVVGATLTSGGQGVFGEALAFDGDNDYVLPGLISELVDAAQFSVSLWFRRSVDHAGVAAETNHAVNNVLIAQSSADSNDNLEIGTEADAVEVYLDTVELGGGPLTTVSQPASIQNDTWHHLVVSYDSAAANELKLYVDGALAGEQSKYGGLLDNAASPFTIGLSRAGSSAWGDFEGLIDDVAVWDASLNAQHVAALFSGTSPGQIFSYSGLVELDLQTALQDQNSSAFIRIPFTASEPELFEMLRLRMQYDDAFVAYINGREIARAGVTGAIQWNSSADADRLDTRAFDPESFLIANQPGLLVHGPNLLAIQLLNFDAAAPRALVLPELEAVRSTPGADGTIVFHQIMTAAQRSELEKLSQRAQQDAANFRSNAQMNATFIAITDSSVDVRYTTGIRLRGNYSRGQVPPNNRINIPADRPWRGMAELTLNVQNIVDQLAAFNLFSVGGLASSSAEPVLMYSNGRNLRQNFPGSVYALVETVNTEYARNHFPTDDGGNLYKGRRREESPPGGQGAGLVYRGTNPASYVSYQKQTNKSAQDWSDVINLTFQLNQSPDATFLQDVAQVVDIDQWLRFLAMTEFLNNQEGGLLLGDELGGDEYAMYRGAVDTRFQLVPVDLDEMFESSSAPLLRFAGVRALNRLVNHIDVLPEYGAKLWELANVILTPDVVTPTLVEALGPLGTESQVGSIVSFLDRRRDFVNNLVLAPVSFDLPAGFVPAGSQLTMSSSGGTIYYTTDSSDPRLPGGEINPQAIQYTGQPIAINESTRIIARAYDGSRPLDRFPMRWSGQTVADYVSAPDLVITEVNYNPHVAQPGEITTVADNFEFVEIMNVGANPIDLDGLQFVQTDVAGDLQGVEFTFASQTLAPDGRIVVVKNRPAFQSRYGTNVSIALGDDGLGGVSGEYRGRLSDRGERLTLIGPSGMVLYTLDYNDANKWPTRPDGGGSSLELKDMSLDPDRPGSWRSSSERGGSPGTAGIGNIDSVVINEVLTNTPGPVNDAIEFFNPTAAPIEIGGMWLSDSLDKLDDYVIPANTIVPSFGYLVLDENDFGFGLSGNSAEDVVLVDPGSAGTPDLFIDHVSFGAALPSESLGRIPNGTGALHPTSSTTLGAENSGPRIGPLVISEIMYNPLDPLLEYVEIYNPTPVPMNLGGWALDGIGYSFPLGTTIGPGQNLVVLPFLPTTTATAAGFNNAYDVDIGANLSGYLGPYPGQLDNGGETLTLQRAAGDPLSGDPHTYPLVIEDQVDFNDMAPWPDEADGSGAALHRTLVDLWGNDPNTWSSTAATPGRYGPRKLFESALTLMTVGEVGTLTDLTHEVQPVTLSRSYTNPVVFAQPASTNGPDVVVVRVSDIQSDWFNVFLVEPSDLNGIHGAGETVSYVVLEAGVHWLPDGTHVEVGTVDTDATVGANIASRSWHTVNFMSRFTQIPIVMSQVQTTKGEAFLSTRQQPAEQSSFQVAIELEELFGPQHGIETVGYLAIDAGDGTWNEMPFLAGQQTFVHSGGRRIPFTGSPFHTTPSFLASLATYVGNDSAHLRVHNADSSGIDVRVEEDTTADTETGHIEESVSYLAIGGSGALTAISTPVGDGLTRSFPLEVVDVGVVHDVDVNLELLHTRVEDLDVFLEAPDGTLVELFSDISGTSDNLTATKLDDEAAESISAGTAPFSGSFQPEGLLGDFDGKDITGTWLLHVTDDTANGETGALLDWSLGIELATDPAGNLNHDSHLNATDIDMLFANLGSDDDSFDLDHDTDADTLDVDHLVLNILGKRYGDADFDQDVDISDFGIMVHHYDPLGHNGFHGWAQGNFNGDDKIDIEDFNRLATNFSPLGYTPGSGFSVAERLSVASPSLAAETATAVSHTGEGENIQPTADRPNTARFESRSDAGDVIVEERLWVDRYFRNNPGSLSAHDQGMRRIPHVSS